MTSQTKPRPYPRAVVRNVPGGHTLRLSHNPEYYFDVANIYPTYDQALADAAAWVRVERAKGKTPTAVAGAPALVPAAPVEKVDGRKVSRKKPIPERCPKCDRKIRRSSEKLTDFPGTVSMALKDGTCQGCYYKERKPAADKASAISAPPAAVESKAASKPKPPAKPVELVPIASEPRHLTAGSGLPGTSTAPAIAKQSAPDGHIVTVLGSGPLVSPGPSDPVERDRASLDAYLRRRGRDGAEAATLREGRGPATTKAGI